MLRGTATVRVSDEGVASVVAQVCIYWVTTRHSIGMPYSLMVTSSNRPSLPSWDVLLFTLFYVDADDRQFLFDIHPPLGKLVFFWVSRCVF